MRYKIVYIVVLGTRLGTRNYSGPIRGFCAGVWLGGLVWFGGLGAREPGELEPLPAGMLKITA